MTSAFAVSNSACEIRLLSSSPFSFSRRAAGSSASAAGAATVLTGALCGGASPAAPDPAAPSVPDIDPKAALDEAAAHVHFSKTCFNSAWELIEKDDRSAVDDERMIQLNQASLWHWSQRADCTDRNRSIGYWQASRIRAVVGHADEAERYARLCMDHSGSLAPFYQAYAHEALARAALARGDEAACRAHAMQARVLAQAIVDEDERELVLADLETLGAAGEAAVP